MPLKEEELNNLEDALKSAVDRKILQSRRPQVPTMPSELTTPWQPETPWQQPTETWQPEKEMPWIPKPMITPEETPQPTPISTTEPPISEPTQDKQWYQRAFDVIGYPFELLRKYVEEPGAAMLWSGVTPKTPESQKLPWLQKEIKEYQQWKAPWGVKGATEFGVTAPLFLLPGTGIGKAVGAGAKSLLGIKVAEEAMKGIEPTAKIAEPIITKLIQVIKGAGKVRKETEVLMSAERVTRATKAAKILAKGEGREAFQASIKQLAGELPKAKYIPPVGQFTENEITQLYNVIKESPKIKGLNPTLDYFNRLNTAKGLDVALLGGAIPQPAQLKLLEDVFGSGLVKSLLSKRSLGTKIFTTALDIAGIPRALLSSWDISGALRQGGFLFARNPLQGIRATGTSLKALLSDKNAALIFENMVKDPQYAKAIEMGLDLTPLPGKIATALKTMEEPFMTKLANWIPGIKASNRAYVTVLNEMRFKQWKNIASQFEKVGAGENDFTQLAKFINYATGRGDFPRQLGQVAPVLNATLFAPRLMFSRFQLPTMLFSSSPLVRKEAIKTFLAFGGFGVGTLSALKLSGATIELDPRSSDFGKAKLGNTRLDVWTGYSQLARFISQFITGQRKTVARGRIQDMPRAEVIKTFLQSKYSPAVGLINDLLRGHTYIGEEIKADVETVKSQLYQRLAPLFIQDLVDAIQTDGIVGGLKALPGVAGVGITTYIPGQTPASKEVTTLREQLAQGKYNMSWTDVGLKMGQLYQTNLEQESPELQTLMQKIEQQRVEKGGISGDKWVDFHNQRTSARTDYERKLQVAQDAYDNGQITAYDFKQIATDAGSALGAIYGHIEKQYSEVMDYLSQPMTPEEKMQTNPNDIAFEEYMALMFGKDMEDTMGQYKFDEADYRRNLFINQWGQDVYNYVTDRIQTSKKVPPLMKELYKSREVMREYWEVRNWWIQKFGEPKTQSALNRMNAFVSRQHTRLRKTNPDIARAYDMFYKKTPII